MVRLIIPAKIKINVLYKDYPSFANKYIECLEDPSNDSLWNELDLEQKKCLQMKNKKATK